MSHVEIAIGLGISRETLEKHYEEELSNGAYARRLEVLDALHKSAVKGNAAAVRAYLAMDPPVAPTPEKPAEKEPELGKKAQAAVDAKKAGDNTEWGDLLPRHGASVQAPGTATKQ